MKYMLLMYGAEGNWTADERAECMTKSLRICDELIAERKLIATSPLEPVATAATVRVKNGRPFITDGPFAETTEQLGGFFLLELENLDDAIAIASRLPPATKGTAEIRPVVALEGLPPSRPIPFAGEGDRKPHMLLAYHDEAHWRDLGDAAHRDAMEEAMVIARQLHERQQYVTCSPLHPTSTATSVRVRNGKRHITDGPFAETNEVLGGFYIIMAESRTAALEVGARHSAISHGPVEVRPLFDLSTIRNS